MSQFLSGLYDVIVACLAFMMSHTMSGHSCSYEIIMIPLIDFKQEVRCVQINRKLDLDRLILPLVTRVPAGTCSSLLERRSGGREGWKEGGRERE